MSKRQKAKARCRSREGQPLLSRRQKVPPQAAADLATWVTITPLDEDQPIPREAISWILKELRTEEDSREGGHSQPHSGTVTRPRRLSVSDLPPLHGPPLKVTPPCRLSPEVPRTASARVKLPPLPPAPAASGSPPRGRAWSAGPVARGYRDPVPPSPWGTTAADGAPATPSPDSSAEGLWRGSAARQSHGLPPLPRAGGMPLCTGPQPAWKHLGHSETQGLTEMQGEHSGNACGDLFRGLAPFLREKSPTKSSSKQEWSSVCQEAEPRVMHRAPGSTQDSTADTGNASVLLSRAQLPEQQSVSDNSQHLETLPKEPEAKWEEEELPETESAREGDSEPQSASLAPLEEEEAEAEAATSALDKESWDKGHNELFPMSEPEGYSGFSASPSSGSPCEERGTRQLPEQTARGKLLCTGPEEASKHPLHIQAEELEKLEEDILSSLGRESPSVPHTLCSWTKGCAGETENHSQLVAPDLFEELWSLFSNEDAPSGDTRIDRLLAKWEEEELPDRDTAGEEDSEPDSTLSLSLQDEGAEPAASPLDSHPRDERHSEPLRTALPEDTKMSVVCAFPAKPADEADAAGMGAGRAQAVAPQVQPCVAEPPAGACPEPAQRPARSVPACPAGSAALPQPPAPRPRRSVLKTARRALRRLFSFSCLRGQPEE